MATASFDPGRVERALGSVAHLGAISLVYVGLNRPVRLGPVALHVTLWALVAPFLLIEVRRLRQSIDDPSPRRLLRRSLIIGAASYASGVLWGDVPAVVCLGLLLLAVASFGGAMATVVGSHGPAELSHEWDRLRRLTLAMAGCSVPVLVLAAGDFRLSRWVLAPLAATGFLASAAAVGVLARTTQRTRAWLRDRTPRGEVPRPVNDPVA